MIARSFQIPEPPDEEDSAVLSWAFRSPIRTLLPLSVL